MESRVGSHPSADTLRAFGLGKLDDAQAGIVIQHLENCPACRQVVTSQSGDDFLARLRDAHGPGQKSGSAESLPGASCYTLAPGKPPPAVADLPPELAANQQYEIIRELGRGGMGVVYLARNRLLDRQEVLKVVNQDTLDRAGGKERFLREIRAAAMLSHRNVVTAHSAVQVGELLVFAMEYIDGEDLAKVVKAHGPLPVSNACYYAQQVALGLQHAADKNMIHRDIKPQNLILAREGKKHVVKILDFGLAKVLREKKERLALTGMGKILGTPDYMAPEQSLDAARVDIRADIYSLGCTLYYLLTGGTPFKGTSVVEIVQAHHLEEAVALNVVRPEVPGALAAVVAKMMAKDPAQRYQKPAEVAQALTSFVKTLEKPPSATAPAPEARPGRSAVSAAGGKAGIPLDVPVGVPFKPQTRSKGSGSIIHVQRTTGVRRGDVARRKWAATLGIGIVGLLLAGLVGLWAGGVFRVQTKDGVLVVHVNEPNADVYVDGPKVTVTWIAGGKMTEIRVKAGTHQVSVMKDGFVAYGEKVKLEDGGRQIITARLEKTPPPSAQAPQTEQIKAGATKKRAGKATGGEPAAERPALLRAPFGEAKAREAQQAWAKYLGRKVEETVDLGGGVMMEFVLIPPGTFTMGSPKEELGHEDNEAQHEVTLPSAFYLGKYTVTQEQYQRLMDANPSHFSPKGAGATVVAGEDTRRFPVERTSWNDAVAFCTTLEKKIGLKAGLPSEAQWEYACRAGTTTPFQFGSSLNGSQANCWGKSPYGTTTQGPYLDRTCAVGSYQPNAFGLCDMHGNVWQWCEDSWGSGRVFRGGSWIIYASYCRAARRDGAAPSVRNEYLGFRLAQVPVGKEIAKIAPQNKSIPPVVEIKPPTKFTNSMGMDFALVPKGKSWLGGGGGKPGTQEVDIPHDFYLGVYDVTQGEWEALMGDNPSWFSRNGKGKDAVRGIPDEDLQRFPVENVSWLDARRFIEKLNAREKHIGWVYRLPTEAEWEYACRGGPISKEESAFDFYFDRPTNDLSSSEANFNGNFPAGNAPQGKYLQRTTKVGSYAPNRLGFYDMHGNVWQCADSAVGGARVIRGGGWYSLARYCRAADSKLRSLSDRDNYLGFRLARVPVGKGIEDGVGKGPQAEVRPGNVPQPEPGVGNKRVTVIPATDNKGAMNVAGKVPSFQATDDQGKVWNSSDHVGKNIIVLYFYPAAFTGGCTKQACGFRDNFKDLTGKNVEVVAVSGDSAKTHGMFKKAYNLPFTLLADEKGSVAKKFGIVTYNGGKVMFQGQELVRGVTISRTTVIIGLDGKIAAKYAVKDAAGDSKKALEIVQSLQK